MHPTTTDKYSRDAEPNSIDLTVVKSALHGYQYDLSGVY